MMAGPNTVQATVVAINDHGILLHGPSGSGKSDLALRLINGGAALVADDFVHIQQRGAQLIAIAPPIQRGRLNVSGLGIARASRHVPEARLSIAIYCVSAPPHRERGPILSSWRWGATALPDITLVALAPSAPDKLRLALERWGL